MKRQRIARNQTGAGNSVIRRLSALFLCMILCIEVFPAGVLAVDSSDTITAVANPETTEYTVENGTAQEDVGLPTELTATISTPSAEDGGDPLIREEELAVNWTGDYDANTAGDYTLTAQFTDEVTLGDGVEMPTVTVTVQTEEESEIVPMTEGDRSLSFVIQNSSAVNLTSAQMNAFVLSENEDLIVQGTYQAAVGTTTAETAIITLPDFYVFNGASGGDNYSINTIEDLASHTLTITFNAPENPSSPNTIGFSFKVKLDRTSITETMRQNWLNGTWDPNTNDRNDFRIVMSDDANRVDNRVTVSTKKLYTEDAANSDNISNKGTSKVFALYGSSAINFWTISETYDVYKHGPLKIDSVEFTLPAGFVFEPSKQETLRDYANISFSTNNRTMTIAYTEDILKTQGKLNVENGSSADWVDAVYRTLCNEITEEIFAPNTTFTEQTKINFKSALNTAYSDTFSKEFKNRDYSLGETGTVNASGTPDVKDENKKVLIETNSGQENVESGTCYSLSRNNSADNLTVPADCGNGYSLEIDYDSDIKVKSFSLLINAVTSVTDWGNDLPCLKASSVTYYVNGTAQTPINLSTETDASKSFAPTLAANESITKVVVTYSKLVYIQGAADYLSNFKFNAPTGNPGEKFPINYTLKNASGTAVSADTNYVKIKEQECPTFVSRVEQDEETTEEYYATAGNYYSGDGTGSLTILLYDSAVGTGTTIKPSVENPIFYLQRKDSGIMGEYAFWNAITLNEVMGGNTWTIQLTTRNARDVFDNRNTLGDSVAAGTTTHTYTIAPFTGTKTIDFYKTADDDGDTLTADDIVLYGTTLSTEGTFDYSSLSGETNRDLFTITKKMPTSTLWESTELACEAFGYSQYGYADSKVAGNGLSVTYDDCTHTDQRHDTQTCVAAAAEGHDIYPSIKTEASIYSDTAFTFAGKTADVIGITGVTSSYGNSTIKQGQQTTITLNLSLNTRSSVYAELWTQGGETAYLHLTDQQYVSFVPGTAKFDGVTDPNAAAVTIDGEKYLKITNVSETPHQKARTAGENGTSTYAPYAITFDVYALPTTPITGYLSVIDDADSWLDITSAQSYNVGDVKVAIQGEYFGVTSGYWSENGTGFNTYAKGCGVQGCRYASRNDCFLYDDPLNLYTDTYGQRNWAINLSGFSSTPEMDAIQGISLNPGVSNVYANSTQDVRPDEEGDMTTAISIVAGNSDMTDLTSTIKIPRAGDTLNRYPGYTTTVSQYLTGPLVSVIAPSDASSTAIAVTYSTNGTDFVAAEDITDWSAVTHIKIDNAMLKANDTALLYIPLTTDRQDSEPEYGGESYWEAVFKATGLAAKSNRMNTYTYTPFTISGTIWNDDNEDGTMDSEESKSSGTAVELWQNYGTETASKLDTTATDTDGAYQFENVQVVDDLSVVLIAPSGKMVTVTENDNDFTQLSGSTNGQAVLPSLTNDVAELDGGLRPITVAKSTVAHLSGTKILHGATMSANQFTFSIAAAEGNPSGAELGTTTTATNAANGSFHFGNETITFGSVGTFQFIVSETGTAPAGYTYDQNPVTVTFVVGMNPAGDALVIESVTYQKNGATAAGITFTNTFSDLPPTGLFDEGNGALLALLLGITALGIWFTIKFRRKTELQ